MAKNKPTGPKGKPLSKSRAVDTREPRYKFLIVCEGAKTEPNYFRSFRVPKNVVEVTIIGGQGNTESLVEKAIELKTQAEAEAEYDQVWCVFDRDSFSAEQFNNAIQRAEAKGMRVAYSNEAFELWYLLHFSYYDTAMARDLLCEKLGESLGWKYQKNSLTMYELLEGRQPAALRNAAKLLDSHQPNHNPATDNPCTTVHHLVEELNRFLPGRPPTATPLL
jgi:hypothetical protein